MKKTLFKIFTILCLIVFSVVGVFAETEQPILADNQISKVINDQGNNKELEKVINKLKQEGSNFEYDLKDKLVLKVSFFPVWSYSGIGTVTDTAILSEYAENGDRQAEEQHNLKFRNQSTYIVFDNKNNIKPVVIHSKEEDGKTVVSIGKTYEEVPRYLQDITDSYIMSLNNSSGKTQYKEILCFDGTTSHGGITVYYLTDTGGTVLYYEDYTTEPVAFEFLDFQDRLTKYVEYSTSSENNYDENGEALYGSPISFLDFIENSAASQQTGKIVFVSVIGAVAVAVAGIVIAAVVICVVRYRRKNSI